MEWAPQLSEALRSPRMLQAAGKIKKMDEGEALFAEQDGPFFFLRWLCVSRGAGGVVCHGRVRRPQHSRGPVTSN